MARLLTGLSLGLALPLAVSSLATTPARAGDPGRGHAVFMSECSTCHSNSRSGGVVIGPPLYGVVGRRAGAVANFAYSKAMKSAGFEWTPDRLRAYLPAPRQYLDGVKMTYPGLKNPAQLEDLIAYLQTLSDSARGGRGQP